MANGRDSGDRYHAAIKSLETAERAYRESMDVLGAAIDKRDAMPLHDPERERVSVRIVKLRGAVKERERLLAAALSAACGEHRAYWQRRRDAMIPGVRAAAEMFRYFNRVAYCARDASIDPALTIVQTVHAEPSGSMDIMDEAGVPVEAPDSELLDDGRGSWCA